MLRLVSPLPHLSRYGCLTISDIHFSEMTTHQKRMAQLQEEIAALEAENVAKKNWTLMGEATSRSRPQNSLLEEDLEFERVMKTIPVITEETVQGLEDRIKARILESQFDDVIRKRPVDDKPYLPSRLFELQDTKSKQSLAEIYEDEYTAAQTGGVTGEDRDGKLKKEHEELTRIWENVSLKLDALCNARFTPKAVSSSLIRSLHYLNMFSAESLYFNHLERCCCHARISTAYYTIYLYNACSRRDICTISKRLACA